MIHNVVVVVVVVDLEFLWKNKVSCVSRTPFKNSSFCKNFKNRRESSIYFNELSRRRRQHNRKTNNSFFAQVWEFTRIWFTFAANHSSFSFYWNCNLHPMYIFLNLSKPEMMIMLNDLCYLDKTSIITYNAVIFQ